MTIVHILPKDKRQNRFYLRKKLTLIADQFSAQTETNLMTEQSEWRPTDITFISTYNRNEKWTKLRFMFKFLANFDRSVGQWAGIQPF